MVRCLNAEAVVYDAEAFTHLSTSIDVLRCNVKKDKEISHLFHKKETPVQSTKRLMIKGKVKAFLCTQFSKEILRTIDSINYLYTNPRYKLV